MTKIHKQTRRVIAVLAAIALLAFAGAAGAGSVLDTQYGAVENWLAADINAMGGTGAALDRGGFGALMNPATLTQGTAWRVDGGMSLAQDHEDRYQPLFDSFTSYVTDTVIASNRHHYLETGFAVSRPLTDRIGFGLSLTSRYDYSYDFAEQIRDPDSFSSPRDRILEDREFVQDGAIRDLGLGFGIDLSPQVSIGAAVHYLFGTVDGHLQRLVYQDDESTSDTSHEWTPDGVSGTFGMTVKPTERLTVGASWELPAELEGDWTTTVATVDTTTAMVDGVTVRYPRRLRGGFAYYPRSEPRTVFTVDVVWSEWSELEDSRVEGDLLFQDTMDYRLGVEHLFYNGVPLRFGFRHFDSYMDDEVATSQFSSGIGIPYADGMFNVSVELRKVESDQEHIFPYPSGFAVEESAQVEETRFRVGASFIYRF